MRFVDDYEVFMSAREKFTFAVNIGLPIFCYTGLCFLVSKSVDHSNKNPISS